MNMNWPSTGPCDPGASLIRALGLARRAGFQNRSFRSSRLQLGHADPGALFPALEAEFGELHALGPFEEGPAEWLVENDVPQEQLPLDLKGVVHRLVGGDRGP